MSGDDALPKIIECVLHTRKSRATSNPGVGVDVDHLNAVLSPKLPRDVTEDFLG
jgi:hypothetical protein